MAKKVQDELDKFTSDLISDINKQHKKIVAFNLGSDVTPTHISDWISSGSIQLDYDISNAPGGGFPVGRIVEIFAQPSTGKSHLAAQICKSAQAKGGIAVYIDSENATNPVNLASLGVNIERGFIYVDTSLTEEIFEIAEGTLLKARAMMPDKPIVIIWDSVAASTPKQEMEGEYDKNTIGLQARVLSKGMRKITNVLGNQRALLVCINQMRMKVGEMFGDPWCVEPFTTHAKFRISNADYLQHAESILGVKGLTTESTFNTSLYTIARIIDRAFGTDAVDSFLQNGSLPKHYNLEAVSEMDANEPLEFFECSELGLHVESPTGFSLVEGFTVKRPVDHHFVITQEKEYPLRVAGGHRVLFEGNFIPAVEHPSARRIDDPISIVDLSVQGEHYIAHGFVHHNTTPGGQAIPFHASVRVKMTGGKKILNKNDDPVGIRVNSQVIKNKVNIPYRKSEFEIHFGKGIVEHEQLFDVLRAAGARTDAEGNTLEVTGTGAWKTFSVVGPTGETILEKKFNKSAFDEVMANANTGPWVTKLIERALVRSARELQELSSAAKVEGEEAD
jgi:protein RecA